MKILLRTKRYFIVVGFALQYTQYFYTTLLHFFTPQALCMIYSRYYGKTFTMDFEIKCQHCREAARKPFHSFYPWWRQICHFHHRFASHSIKLEEHPAFRGWIALLRVLRLKITFDNTWITKGIISKVLFAPKGFLLVLKTFATFLLLYRLSLLTNLHW